MMLLFSLGLLLLLALGGVYYPLRRSSGLALSLLFVLAILVSFAYWYWGGWVAWQDFQQEAARKEQAKKVLQTIKGPEELIAKLKAKVQAEPNQVRGWYLLGRLYMSQGMWSQAQEAFLQAKALQPHDEQILVNYALSRWEVNHQLDKESRAILKQVLAANKQQPDALSLLAMDAFKVHDYEQAINYWQQLLAILPPQSDEARAVHRAIVAAQGEIK